MGKATITFRTETVNKQALDRIAAGIQRDRSYVLNAAIQAYIEAYRWQVQEIKQGLKEADAGDFASAAEVRAAFSKLASKR